MVQTNAQRQKAYRDRKREAGTKFIQFQITDKFLLDVIDEFGLLVNQTRSEVMEGIIMTWACDTAEAMPALKAKIAEMKKKRGEK